jgi:phospholipase/lecithinase/hemolysin
MDAVNQPPGVSMFRTSTSRCRTLSFCAAAFVPLVLSAQTFSSLTFFGDSYSDTGNLTQLTGGAFPPPPYAPGRYSNGLVWVDRFAAMLGRPTDATPSFVSRAASGNYAVAGAQTQDRPGGSPGSATQVASYLTRPGATPSTRTDATGLYTLFIGGNDLNAAASLTDAAARTAAAQAAAQRVLSQAGTLAVSGARNIMVFTLPSLGFTPGGFSVPGRPTILDQLSLDFNTALAAGLTTLQGANPLARFLNFRLDNLVTNILIDSRSGGALYGFTNLTTPCFLPGAPSCDTSLWVDDIHPTTRAHAIIADAAFRYVTTGQNVGVVPEPASVVLMLSGLIGLGGIAVRRRARAA